MRFRRSAPRRTSPSATTKTDSSSTVARPKAPLAIMSLLTNDWGYAVNTVASSTRMTRWSTRQASTCTRWPRSPTTPLAARRRSSSTRPSRPTTGRSTRQAPMSSQTDGRYWTGFDRTNPIEGAAREQVWTGTAHALIAELGVGSVTASALQIGLGMAALLAGFGSNDPAHRPRAGVGDATGDGASKGSGPAAGDHSRLEVDRVADPEHRTTTRRGPSRPTPFNVWSPPPRRTIPSGDDLLLLLSCWMLDPDPAATRSLDEVQAALDAAVRGIAGLDLGRRRVLQVIVDRVRPLVGAQYAAAGDRRRRRPHRAIHHERDGR